MNGIIRDPRYWQTLRRDRWRQRLRRWVHRGMQVYEKWIHVRRWQGVARADEAQNNPKKLSICIITMNAAHRILPLLAYLRPLADELVVGVDSKTTDETFQRCQESGLVDELFVIENAAQTCNGGLEALVSRCHGDWVLRLDDDEFPEPHLAKILPGLMATARYTHYKFPRLHLAAVDPESLSLSWIDDGYLYPDFQMRLFRNVPALLSFPGAVGHGSVHCQGPRGKVNTVNLVHLNMAMNPREQREEKLKRYVERLEGGWVHPVNEHALLFEDFHYAIRPYEYPDPDFCRILAQTTLGQRAMYASQSTFQATTLG